MSVLITGAGLIASRAGQELQAQGEEPIFFDRDPYLPYLASIVNLDSDSVFIGDVTDLDSLVRVVRQKRVSTILHTAALIGARVSNDPRRGVQVNVDGTMAVIEAARLTGISRLIFCSSVAIYDFDRLAEGAFITEESPVGPKNLYGATKLAAEYLLEQYGKLDGIQIIHLRLAGVYGRGQYKGGSWMGLILNRILEATVQGQPSILQPEWIGTQEYVYVKDVALACRLACLAQGPLHGAFNIGTGKLHSYAEVVAEIKQLVPSANIEIAGSHSQTASYLTRTQPFDISKARSVLGFNPRFTLSTGLADYLAELRNV